MAVNKFEIASQALVLVGANPIVSFDGAGAENVAASTLYEAAVRELLGAYPWRFSTRKVQLTRLVAVPPDEWDAAYQMPADILTVHAVRVSDEPIEFDRYEDQVLCGAQASDVVIGELTFRSSEPYWPAYFETALRYKLASYFAIPLADDTDKASLYEGKFLRAFGSAKTQDAQARTARKLRGVGGLARYHGGRA